MLFNLEQLGCSRNKKRQQKERRKEKHPELTGIARGCRPPRTKYQHIFINTIFQILKESWKKMGGRAVNTSQAILVTSLDNNHSRHKVKCILASPKHIKVRVRTCLIPQLKNLMVRNKVDSNDCLGVSSHHTQPEKKDSGFEEVKEKLVMRQSGGVEKQVN